MVITFWCATRASACASLRSRAWVDCCDEPPPNGSLRRTLSATLRSSSGSYAAYTTPIAPAPTVSRITYRPSAVPRPLAGACDCPASRAASATSPRHSGHSSMCLTAAARSGSSSAPSSSPAIASSSRQALKGSDYPTRARRQRACRCDMLRTVSAGLPLATAFAASSDGAQIDEELEGRLARTIARARAAWPGISVQDGVFLRHLGERVPAERLERAFVEDLYLACACARGDVRAIEVFDQKYFGVLATGLAAKGIDESVADEVVQRLRTQVFVVGNGGRAKIADYAGKGPIRGWLHVAGVRLASKLRRAEANRATVARDAAAEGVPADDPEFATIR